MHGEAGKVTNTTLMLSRLFCEYKRKGREEREREEKEERERGERGEREGREREGREREGERGREGSLLCQ